MAFYSERTNRAKLIAALRGQLPADFAWDFAMFYTPKVLPETPEHEKHCGFAGCAVGLAYHLGMIEHDDVDDLARAIGLSQLDTDCLLSSSYYGLDGFLKSVTPAMVADALENLDYNHNYDNEED